jgi:hypothetical protein
MWLRAIQQTNQKAYASLCMTAEALLILVFTDFATYCLNRLRSQLSNPNVAAEWLALLFRIREAPGSNLGLETDYPD